MYTQLEAIPATVTGAPSPSPSTAAAPRGADLALGRCCEGRHLSSSSGGDTFSIDFFRERGGEGEGRREGEISM